MSHNDLDPYRDFAKGPTTIAVKNGVEPLWVGAAQIIADSSNATVDLAQYEIAALLPDDTLVKFVPGTHGAAQAVIMSQPAKAGGRGLYWSEGYFNHAALVWPTGAALDTYAERKAFFTGVNIRVGHVI